MYDSVGGRFCSRDPIGYVGTQHNLFEYVHSRPVRAIDPSGLVEVVPTTMHPPTTNSNPVQIDFSNEPRSYARCGFVNFSSKMSVPQGTGPGTIIVYTYLTCLVGCPKQEPYTYRELKAFPVANDPIDLSFDYNDASYMYGGPGSVETPPAFQCDKGTRGYCAYELTAWFLPNYKPNGPPWSKPGKYPYVIPVGPDQGVSLPTNDKSTKINMRWSWNCCTSTTAEPTFSSSGP